MGLAHAQMLTPCFPLSAYNMYNFDNTVSISPTPTSGEGDRAVSGPDTLMHE